MRAAVDSSAADIVRCIRLARDGESNALGRLIGHYRNYVRLVAATCLDAELRSKMDASDVAQETLLKVHQNFGQFHGATEGEFVAWIRRILANQLTDFRRRRVLSKGREAARERSLDDVVDSSSMALERLVAASTSSPSERAQRREQGVILADALAALDDDDRDVITLRNLKELPWADVASRMGRSSDAVRMLWTRALRRLGERMGDDAAR